MAPTAFNPAWRLHAARGARDIAGPALGTAAVGLVTGVAMAKSGLALPAVIGTSLLVYASASQLVCLPLIVAGAPLWVILVTACALNLRFLVFSVHWREHLGHLPRAQRVGLAYLAGDPIYAGFVRRFPKPRPMAGRVAYFLGLALTNWCAWQLSSLLGIFLADAVPLDWGLRFIGVLALLALACPMLSDHAAWLSAAVAGAVAVGANGWPFGLHVLAAIAAAIATGLFADRWLARRGEARA